MSGDVVLTDLLRQARAAGLEPYTVEAGPRDFREMAMVAAGSGTILLYCGLPVRPREVEGLCVLAKRRGKIGKYEVVCPTRFEERA